MNSRYHLADVAALISHPARAAMLVALLDGRAHAAGELATEAQVSAQSASLHLHQLLQGELITVTVSGRHRYYRIARPEVAQALEVLGAIATHPHRRPASASRSSTAMRHARSCYDHLAGAVAVLLTEQMERSGLLIKSEPRAYQVGPRMDARLLALGIDLEALRRMRRPLARPCLDWTERRDHLAGALGAALCKRFFEMGWIARRDGTRALRITDAGRRGLATHFEISCMDA